ncbi:MAG: trigger factor [Actinobacteria bacterium]|uniref:peptidylprolyl isomerase n=1 Tax=freshwater metagenome TaxID=449393 RepID=A0A6J6NT98_9ZZZZ|nr:trigger factor [Actinomycetota bacterium]
MKSDVTTLSPTRVRLDIEVPFAELDSHIAEAYKAISKQVNIPGFRKGKIPNTLIDQRFGRAYVLEEAINKSIPVFYAQAARENEVRVVGRPDVDLTELNEGNFIKFTVEVDIRPEIVLPDFAKLKVTVDDAVATDAEIDEQVDGLRARFGTLTALDRAVQDGDFLSIDLVARIDGVEVEDGIARNISYEAGTNRMIDGLDDAIRGMSAGETKSFATTLLGAHEGQTSEVEVTVHSVKERILPELNDEFAALASEFDTLVELRADVVERMKRLKAMEQGAQARDRLLEQLLESMDIPLPEGLVEEEIHAHLEGEGRLEDAEHRAEVNTEVRQSLKSSFLLDAIASAEKVEVTDAELSEYLMRSAMRYGMSPDEFTQQLVQSGNLTAVFSEVARAKAMATILERVQVKDASGKVVDLAALRPKPALED